MLQLHSHTESPNQVPVNCQSNLISFIIRCSRSTAATCFSADGCPHGGALRDAPPTTAQVFARNLTSTAGSDGGGKTRVAVLLFNPSALGPVEGGVDFRTLGLGDGNVRYTDLWTNGGGAGAGKAHGSGKSFAASIGHSTASCCCSSSSSGFSTGWLHK